MRIKLIIILLTIISLVAACSTPPKNPGDVYSVRKQAEAHLALGNRDADRGDFKNALNKLDAAMKFAVAADDSSLRIRAGLSRGNALFSLGRGEEAEEAWNAALREAERVKNSEMAAVSRVHIERGKLLSAAADKSVAQAVRDEVERNRPQIKDRYYTAFAWTIIGLAENKLEHYDLAEAAVRRALDIHEKDVYLELAGYDWYMIASFLSKKGDYRGAIQALEKAIDFDRRVENSWGLASDWRAMGDVHGKAGDAEASGAAYLRAAEIFHAIDNDEASGAAYLRAAETFHAIGNAEASRAAYQRAAEIFSAAGNEEAAAKALNLAENGQKP
jgi:tetratricopeptide (TPR) repeat protein